jgi:hypothetical protein
LRGWARALKWPATYRHCRLDAREIAHRPERVEVELLLVHDINHAVFNGGSRGWNGSGQAHRNEALGIESEVHTCDGLGTVPRQPGHIDERNSRRHLGSEQHPIRPLIALEPRRGRAGPQTCQSKADRHGSGHHHQHQGTNREENGPKHQHPRPQPDVRRDLQFGR